MVSAYITRIPKTSLRCPNLPLCWVPPFIQVTLSLFVYLLGFFLLVTVDFLYIVALNVSPGEWTVFVINHTVNFCGNILTVGGKL